MINVNNRHGKNGPKIEVSTFSDDIVKVNNHAVAKNDQGSGIRRGDHKSKQERMKIVREQTADKFKALRERA
jgi:hypothetical protein